MARRNRTATETATGAQQGLSLALRREIAVTGIPEALAALRGELAGCLREEADRAWASGEKNAVDMAVCQSLRRVASVFEAGLKSAADVEG